MHAVRRWLVLALTALALPLASAQAAPIRLAALPPTSLFIFSPSVVGGTTTVKALSPQGVGSPIKPATRTEYDVANSPLSYRVDVFRLAAEATSSFYDQLGVLPSVDQFIHITHPAVPGERLYLENKFGNTVAMLVLHNVEFVSITSLPDAGLARDQAIQQVLEMEALLVGRLRGYVGQAPHHAPVSAPPPAISQQPINSVRICTTQYYVPLLAACGRAEHVFSSADVADNSVRFCAAFSPRQGVRTSLDVYVLLVNDDGSLSEATEFTDSIGDRYGGVSYPLQAIMSAGSGYVAPGRYRLDPTIANTDLPSYYITITD